MAERQINDKVVDNPGFLKQLVQTFLRESLEQEVATDLPPRLTPLPKLVFSVLLRPQKL